MSDIGLGRLPRHLEATFQGYAFEAVDKRGAFAYSSVAEWRRITEVLNEYAEAALGMMKDDPALYAEEKVHADKGQVCWRLRGMGRLFYPTGLIVRNPEQAAWLTPYFRAKGKRYVAWLESQSLEDIVEAYFGGEVILNSGKGAPLWMPGSDSMGGVLTYAALRGTRTIEEIIRWSMTFGWPPLITIYDRVQASRKEEPLMQLMYGELVQTGTFRAPKVRPVKAVPFSLNIWVVGFANLHRWLLKKITQRHAGTIEYAQRIANSHEVTWASDLSAYDETVSVETLAAYRTWVMEPLLRVLVRKGIIEEYMIALIIQIDEYIALSDMLTPPIALGTAAMRVPTAGAIKSGERLTSNKGSDINDSRTEAKASQLGLKVEWTNFGDDLLLGSDDPKARDKWFAEGVDDHGFVEGPADDTSFLMRRIPQGYSYFNRMMFRSLNREVQEEPKGVLQCALGMRTRYELLRNTTGTDMNPATDLFFPALEATESALTDAAMLAKHTTLLQLLEMVAAQQTYAGSSQGMLSPQDYDQLISLLGKQAVDRVLMNYRGKLVQRSGMRLDEFESAAAAVSQDAAMRALHKRGSR